MINRDYLKNLNDAQKEAVLHIDGPLLIVAGAGSVKSSAGTYTAWTEVMEPFLVEVIRSCIAPISVARVGW